LLKILALLQNKSASCAREQGFNDEVNLRPNYDCSSFLKNFKDMPLSLNELCLYLLDHPLNRALVCGSSWPKGEIKELILNFNLIHLFVVSGAHALFFEKLLKLIGLNKKVQLLVLLIYVFICNFSSPIARCFFERLSLIFLNKIGVFLPASFFKLLSAALTLPTALLKGEMLSLILSLYFSTLVTCLGTKKHLEFKFILLAAPTYISMLGLPPLSALLPLILLSPLIGFLILPLSFLGLAFDKAEWLSHSIWWEFLNGLEFLNVFFNYPKKGSTDFENLNWLLGHLVVLLITLHIGTVFWKRKSFVI